MGRLIEPEPTRMAACHPDRPEYGAGGRFGPGLCKPCYMRRWASLPANAERRRVAYRRHAAENRDRINARQRDYHARVYREVRYVKELPRKYGLTEADYEALLAAQDGRCAICRRLNGRRRFDVDHDHETGAVRGLLCSRCNLTLERVEDLSWWEMAAAYLASPPAESLRISGSRPRSEADGQC